MGFHRRRRRVEGGAPRAEKLGTVSCPTGDLLLLDFGLLRLWSGDAAPRLDAAAVPREVAGLANDFVDFEIVGPDAAAVAASADLAAVKGRIAFDMPADGALITERVASVCEARGLQARVVRVDRIPHRQRVRRLLDEHPDGIEVPFHGMWGVAIRGAPRNRTLPIHGVRMNARGPDAGRWHSVWVDLTPGDPVSSAEAGHVLVDEARLMFADPLVLNDWRGDEPVDGLADLAFWGRDAAGVAERLEADVLYSQHGQDVFGWSDRPLGEAMDRFRLLHAVHEEPQLRFAMDFRPHNDHHRLLTLARTSPTESGTIEVGGFDVTGFFTTWGDGAFPVFRDLDAEGRLCRFRVELAGI